jgi:hypothetical protein
MPTVMFIHGLWLHPTSWTDWRELFEAAGYETVAPEWPGALPGRGVHRQHRVPAGPWPAATGAGNPHLASTGMNCGLSPRCPAVTSCGRSWSDAVDRPLDRNTIRTSHGAGYRLDPAA